MSQSRTLCIGTDVHTEAMAVTSVAQDHGAEVLSLGSIGTRQCAREHRIRQMPSQATYLLFVSAAGPCGDWLSRSLTTQGEDGGGVAPSLLPKKAGDRVKTERRDAVRLAHLARSGARTAVSVLTGGRCSHARANLKKCVVQARFDYASIRKSRQDTLPSDDGARKKRKKAKNR